MRHGVDASRISRKLRFFVKTERRELSLETINICLRLQFSVKASHNNYKLFKSPDAHATNFTAHRLFLDIFLLFTFQIRSFLQ